MMAAYKDLIQVYIHFSLGFVFRSVVCKPSENIISQMPTPTGNLDNFIKGRSLDTPVVGARDFNADGTILQNVFINDKTQEEITHIYNLYYDVFLVKSFKKGTVMLIALTKQLNENAAEAGNVRPVQYCDEWSLKNVNFTSAALFMESKLKINNKLQGSNVVKLVNDKEVPYIPYKSCREVHIATSLETTRVKRQTLETYGKWCGRWDIPSYPACCSKKDNATQCTSPTCLPPVDNIDEACASYSICMVHFPDTPNQEIPHCDCVKYLLKDLDNAKCTGLLRTPCYNYRSRLYGFMSNHNCWGRLTLKAVDAYQCGYKQSNCDTNKCQITPQMCYDKSLKILNNFLCVNHATCQETFRRLRVGNGDPSASATPNSLTSQGPVPNFQPKENVSSNSRSGSATPPEARTFQSARKVHSPSPTRQTMISQAVPQQPQARTLPMTSHTTSPQAQARRLQLESAGKVNFPSPSRQTVPTQAASRSGLAGRVPSPAWKTATSQRVAAPYQGVPHLGTSFGGQPIMSGSGSQRLPRRPQQLGREVINVSAFGQLGMSPFLSPVERIVLLYTAAPPFAVAPPAVPELVSRAIQLHRPPSGPRTDVNRLQQSHGSHGPRQGPRPSTGAQVRSSVRPYTQPRTASQQFAIGPQSSAVRGSQLGQLSQNGFMRGSQLRSIGRAFTSQSRAAPGPRLGSQFGPPQRPQARIASQNVHIAPTSRYGYVRQRSSPTTIYRSQFGPPQRPEARIASQNVQTAPPSRFGYMPQRRSTTTIYRLM